MSKYHLNNFIVRKYLHFKASTKIAIFFIFLGVISTLLVLFAYNKLHVNVVYSKLESYSMQNLNTINSKIDSIINNANEYSKYIISGYYSSKNNINSENLLYTINEYYDINSVYIIDNYFNLYGADKTELMSLKIQDIGAALWYDEMIDKDGGYILSLNAGNVFNDKERNYISLIRLIRDIESPRKKIGTLILNISIDEFDEIIKENKSADLILLDDNNNTISSKTDIYSREIENILDSSNGKEPFSQVTKLNNEYYVKSYLLIEEYNWKLIGFTPIDNSNFSSFQTIIIFVLLLNVLILFLGVMFVKNVITIPIENLIHEMSKINTSNFKPIKMSNKKNEISDLVNNYNILINSVIEKEREKKLFSLKIIQNQINSHFLYNTIDDIKLIAHDLEKSFTSDRNCSKLTDSLNTLSSFYRNILSRGKSIIKIDEEVQLTKLYIDLICLNPTRKCIKFIFDIDDKVGKYKIVKMTLQPLIENSIKHGLSYLDIDEEKSLKIIVKKVNDKIKLIIEDNGIGIEKETLNKLRQYIDGEDIDYTFGFGLKTVINHLNTYFKDDMIYFIESVKNKYTRIIFIFTAI